MSELEVSIEHINQQLTKQAKIFGFGISADMDKIVQLKKDFFGNDFYDCPCHPDDQQ
jgi:hypothetical protein